MRKVSLLGYGWLGKYIAEALQKSDYEIHASTTTPLKILDIQNKGFIPYQINLNELTAVPSAFLESSIHIINIPPSKVKSNYFTTLEQYCKTIPTHVTIVFISSTSVYPTITGTYHEDSEVVKNQLSLSEDLIRKIFQKHLILRCAGLFDIERHPAHFLSGKKNIDGPNSTVNLVHGQDVANILTTLLSSGAFGTYNISFEIPFSKQLFYTQMCALKNMEPPTFNLESASSSRVISSNKVQQLTNNPFEHTKAFLSVLI